MTNADATGGADPAGRINTDLAPAMLLRLAPSFGVAALCFWLIGRQFGDITLSGVAAAMASVPVGSVVLASVFAAGGLFAVSCYDLPAFHAAHRRPGAARYAPWPRLLKGGFAGSVFAQSLGFGVLTGGAARARIYRANGVSAVRAGVISLIAALGFVGGAVSFIAVLSALTPKPIADLTGLGPETIRLAALLALAAPAVAAMVPGRRRPMMRRMLRDLWLFTGLTALDLCCAALAFAVLAPEGAAPDIVGLILIFAVATLAGHLTSVPGGAGAFDVILLTAFAPAIANEIVAAILIYRLIYYVAPLIPATALVLSAARAPDCALAEGAELSDRVAWAADASETPEAELAFLGDKRIYQPRALAGFAMFAVSGRVWLMLGDPIAPRGEWTAIANGLEAEARAVGATLAVYKATAEAAAFWRARGMTAAPFGEEAGVPAREYSTAGPEKRELRRKIRAAAKAGMIVRHHQAGDAPMDDLSDVADQWLMDKTTVEQGFSMGLWRPDFVRRHEVFSGWVDGAPVAFITCWKSGDGAEWMLDLVRRTPDAPKGAVYALVADAIGESARAGASRFNLCMAPLSGLVGHRGAAARAARFFYDRFGDRYGLHGMRRFKSAFRPEWRTRYIAGRGPLALAEASLAARRLVRGAAADYPNGIRPPRLEAPNPVTETRAAEGGLANAAAIDRRSASA